VNLNTAAATAVSHGGIGALFVQIIAGYNLVAADTNGTSDPYVRVTLGKRTQRTPVICDTLNPTWNASPFVFEVPSLETVVSFEVLDSDFFKDDPLGDFDVRVSEVPIDAESSLVRRRLANVPHGEIELKLYLLLGKEMHHVPHPWQTGIAETLVHDEHLQEISTQEPGSNLQDDAMKPQSSMEHGNTQASTEAQQQQSTTPWTPWGPPRAPPTTTPPTSARTRTQTNSNNPFGPEPEGERNLTPKVLAKQANPFGSNPYASEGAAYAAEGNQFYDQTTSPKFPANPFARGPSSRKPSVSAPVTPRKSSNPFPSEKDVSPRTPHITGYPGAEAWKDPSGTTPNVSPRNAWPPAKAPPVVAVRPNNPFMQAARTSFPAKARNPFSQPPS